MTNSKAVSGSVANEGQRDLPAATQAQIREEANRAPLAQGHAPRLNATVQFGPNGVTVRNNGPVEGRAHFIDKSMVTTPWGTQTPRTVAESMGWVDQAGAWIGPGANQQVSPQGTRQPLAGTQAPQVEAQDKQQEKSEALTPAMTEALPIMRQAEAALGADQYQAVLHKAALSGDIAGNTPEGYTPAQAATVVQGLSDYADRVLADTGASVAVLSAVLSETQLADARRAVVQQNVAAIKAYGKEAIKGLVYRAEVLPDV